MSPSPRYGTLQFRHDDCVKRVSIVGNAGSGKTGLADRVAAALGGPQIELDAIHQLRGWEAMDPDELQFG